MKQENAYKIKLLKLLEILRQDSDEDHYIGTTELIEANSLYIKKLEGIVLEEIKGIDFVLNCDKERKPGIMSISFPGRDGELLLHRLDLKGIMISTGAACDSVNTQISHVLSALDMDESVAKGTIRISLSKDNTEDEAHRIGQALCEILQ